MAKRKATKGMHDAKDRKTKGRTSITGSSTGSSQLGDDTGPRATRPHVPQVLRREATRPVSAGAGKKRGDRRDMNQTYTTTQRHASRGNNIRPDVSTRKR
jgi:hypothetical protein